MQHTGGWLRRYGPRRATWSGWRCLALVLVFAFAVSAAFHGFGGNSAALAAAHGHEPASMAQDFGDGSCCPVEVGDAHGASCATAGGCPFCVPVVPAAAFLPPRAAPIEPTPGTTGPGDLPTPHFRPPRPAPSV